MRVVASVCVDTEENDQLVFYPMISKRDSSSKRLLYWKMAYTLLCSSMRCNPEAEHVIFTNDPNDINYGNTDLKAMAVRRGITVKYLPFEKFKPPTALCSSYKNAFYKLDVIAALGAQDNTINVLLDTDCLWIRSCKDFESLMFNNEILLYDTYQRTDPYLKEPHNLSMFDMGRLYREIDSDYPNAFPVWYGGEIIAGYGSTLALLAERFVAIYNKIADIDEPSLLKFSNGKSIFDGDEFLTNFVYNDGTIKIKSANEIIKRIWTSKQINNASSQDLKLQIWHLPAEKETGLDLLFKKAIDLTSAFWKIDLEMFPKYVGEFVGVPRRSLKYAILTHPMFIKLKQRLY